MTVLQRPLLLDTTRLISRSWTGRRSTGIDRVCNAYFDHFSQRAHAVIQYRGVVRVLDALQSDDLFALLRGPDGAFRRGLARYAPRWFARSRAVIEAQGRVYLNASHTDFDLASHARWVGASGLRSVYFLHDLIPITHQGLCHPLATRRHLGRVVSALRGAAGIIVNSRDTARQLHQFASDRKLLLPPMLTAPLAGADLGRAANGAALARGHQPGLRRPMPDHSASLPYFVTVGTIEPRKNHLLLLRVWRRLAARLGERTPRLVIAGQWGRNSEPVREMLKTCPVLRRHVDLQTFCSDAELGHWITGAEALLLPTLAEGFGLPLVEALRLGTPVIASDIPSFREVGQGIPLLLDPHDEDGWNAALADFMTPASDRKRQLQLMPSFRPLTWGDHFTSVEAWLAALPQASRNVVQETGNQCLSA